MVTGGRKFPIGKAAGSKGPVVFFSIMAFLILFGLFTTSSCLADENFPIIPSAEGFGITTPAGRGGRVVKVTNLKASGPGSLRWALEAVGPRVVVFEVGGTIRIKKELIVINPYLTVAGQTAPSPGITIRGAGLRIKTHDVLLQHLRIRVGDDFNGPDPGNRDALGIEPVADNRGDVRDIVIDHCSFSWAVDEIVALWYNGVSNITIRNSIISQALHQSIHPKGPHGMGMIVGWGISNILITGNLFAHNNQRNPLLSGGTRVIFLNNVIYNYGELALHYQGRLSEQPVATSIVGNVFIPGRNSSKKRRPIYVPQSVTPRSFIYLSDQYCPVKISRT